MKDVTIVLWVSNRLERKRWWNINWGHSASEPEKSEKGRGECSLGRTAWVRVSKRKKKKKNIDSKEKLWAIHAEEESNEWKRKKKKSCSLFKLYLLYCEFKFGLSVIISILYSKIIWDLSRNFYLQGENFFHSCVVVLSLILLNFFPTRSPIVFSCMQDIIKLK